MYDTRTRSCTFVKEPIEKAGPNNWMNVQCFIFLVGFKFLHKIKGFFDFSEEEEGPGPLLLLREVTDIFITNKSFVITDVQFGTS